MRRWVVSLACLLTVGFALVAKGQTSPRNYDVYGVGTVSCGTWTQAREWEALAYRDWVMGFVSGAGYAGQAPLRETDGKGIIAFMDTYCQTHPVDKVVVGAQALIAALRKSAS